MSKTNKTSDESRQHFRYILGDEAIARVFFGNNHAYPIFDISYSGFSVDGSINRLASNEIKLEILGQSANGYAKLVYGSDKRSGFCFEHKGIETLVFLQPFLERLRGGASLVALPKDVLNDKYKGQSVAKFGGDGPIDLTVKYNDGASHTDANAEIVSLLLTFKDHMEYKELRYRDGHIYTGRQLDNEGLAARMAETISFDRAIARQGAAILLGAQDETLKNQLRKIIAIVARQLSKS